MTRRELWLVMFGAVWDGGLDRIWPVERVPLLGAMELAFALSIAISLSRRPRPKSIDPEAPYDDHDD